MALCLHRFYTAVWPRTKAHDAGSGSTGRRATPTRFTRCASAIAAVRDAPRDPEARRRLRALAAEQGLVGAARAAARRRGARRRRAARGRRRVLRGARRRAREPRPAARGDRGDGGGRRARARRRRSPRSARVAVPPRRRGGEGGRGVRARRAARAATIARARRCAPPAGCIASSGRLERAVEVYRTIVERRPTTSRRGARSTRCSSELGRWREVAEVRGALAARANGVEKAALLRSQARALEQAGDAGAAARVVARGGRARARGRQRARRLRRRCSRARVAAREAADVLAQRITEAVADGAPADDVAALRLRLVDVLEDAAAIARRRGACSTSCSRRRPSTCRRSSGSCCSPRAIPIRACTPPRCCATPRRSTTARATRGLLDRGRAPASARPAICARAAHAFERAAELVARRRRARARAARTRATALVVEIAAAEATRRRRAAAERRLRKILLARSRCTSTRTSRSPICSTATERARRRRRAPARRRSRTRPRTPRPSCSRSSSIAARRVMRDARRRRRSAPAAPRGAPPRSHATSRSRSRSARAASRASCGARPRSTSARSPTIPTRASTRAAVAAGLVRAAQAEVRALRPRTRRSTTTAAVRIDPECAPAWHALAELATERGDMARAAECLEREAERDRRMPATRAAAVRRARRPRARRARRSGRAPSGAGSRVAERRHAPVLDKLLALQRKRGATIERGETCERLAARCRPTSARKKELIEEAAEAFAAGGDLGARVGGRARRSSARYPHDVDSVGVRERASRSPPATHERAANWLRRALTAWDAAGDRGDGDPRRAELWRRLGDAERARGNERAALDAYQRAVVTAPESDGALAARRGLVELAAAHGRAAQHVARSRSSRPSRIPTTSSRGRASSRPADETIEDARAMYELARALGIELLAEDEQFLDRQSRRALASDEAYAAALDEPSAARWSTTRPTARSRDLLLLLGEAAQARVSRREDRARSRALFDAKRLGATSDAAVVAMYPQIAKALGGPATLLYATDAAPRPTCAAARLAAGGRARPAPRRDPRALAPATPSSTSTPSCGSGSAASSSSRARIACSPRAASPTVRAPRRWPVARVRRARRRADAEVAREAERLR